MRKVGGRGFSRFVDVKPKHIPVENWNTTSSPQKGNENIMLERAWLDVHHAEAWPGEVSQGRPFEQENSYRKE